MCLIVHIIFIYANSCKKKFRSWTIIRTVNNLNGEKHKFEIRNKLLWHCICRSNEFSCYWLYRCCDNCEKCHIKLNTEKDWKKIRWKVVQRKMTWSILSKTKMSKHQYNFIRIQDKKRSFLFIKLFKKRKERFYPQLMKLLYWQRSIEAKLLYIR